MRITGGLFGVGILMLFAAIIFSGCTSTPALQKEMATAGMNPGLRNIFEKYRASIPQFMQKNRMPGLSIAVVDRKRILWTAGFGATDTDGKTPVTPDTLFSFQSASKSITATLVMIAVQEGILDLDKPITRAVPGFTVNSRFEQKPNELMTLRHLLYNTSGLGHEAPVGNNINPYSPSFEDHIRSISETWLKHRVGEHYTYSNLGFDLAAFAIQSASGMPFERYAEKKLFKELGMDRSTFNQVAASAIPDRAIGHDRDFNFIPANIPMLGSGGAWTTARDLARFVQFHLSHGEAGGRQLFDPRLLNSMYLLPATWSNHTYAMGFSAVKRNGSYFLNHSGGGFGFYTTMSFYPEFGIGCVALTNSVDHNAAQVGLVDSMLDALIALQHTDKAVSTRFPSVEEVFKGYPAQAPITERTANFGTPWKQDYEKHIGTYQYVFGEWRFTFLRSHWRTDIFKIHKCSERLCINGETLEEFHPGLFFTESGESLDFTRTPPRWKSVSLEKIH